MGAHVGFYSLLASVLVGNQGRVYCFEPLAANIVYLRKHREMNRIHNCEILEAAVAAVDGYSQLDPCANRSTARLSARGQHTVRTVALDSLVERGEIPPPQVIKIDIEGGESAALQGASRVIAKHCPIIFLATHGPEVHRSCLEFFARVQYRLESLTSEPVETSAELIGLPTLS